MNSRKMVDGGPLGESVTKHTTHPCVMLPHHMRTKAIVVASKGKAFGPQPEWWASFEEQYEPFRSNDNYEGADQELPRLGFEKGRGVVVGA